MLRHNFFSKRVVHNWNNLPNCVVEARTTNAYKKQLDKHWKLKKWEMITVEVLTPIYNRTFSFLYCLCCLNCLSETNKDEYIYIIGIYVRVIASGQRAKLSNVSYCNAILLVSSL
jgi:hypothetical protein